MLKRSATSFPKKNINLNMLDLLDDVEIDLNNLKVLNIEEKKFICKICNKILFNKKLYENHKDFCYEKKIEELNLKYKNQKEEIIHDLRIKFLEMLIEHNNNKWNKINNIK